MSHAETDLYSIDGNIPAIYQEIQKKFTTPPLFCHLSLIIFGMLPFWLLKYDCDGQQRADIYRLLSSGQRRISGSPCRIFKKLEKRECYSGAANLIALQIL